MVYPALLPLMCTSRLPVVDWTDAPADLNGLVRFAERRNLVSACVSSHFNWPLNLHLNIRLYVFAQGYPRGIFNFTYISGIWFKFFFIVLSRKETFRFEILDSAAHKYLSLLHRWETWEGHDYVQGRGKLEFVLSLFSGILSLCGLVDEDKSCL